MVSLPWQRCAHVPAHINICPHLSAPANTCHSPGEVVEEGAAGLHAVVADLHTWGGKGCRLLSQALPWQGGSTAKKEAHATAGTGRTARDTVFGA